MQRIADDMQAIRSIRCSTRRSTSEYLMFCMVGFGSLERRESRRRQSRAGTPRRVIAAAQRPHLAQLAYHRPQHERGLDPLTAQTADDALRAHRITGEQRLTEQAQQYQSQLSEA
jgi:hypothetical protein